MYNEVVIKVIKYLEGGYYHPDMLKDGRIKDSRYGASGETTMNLIKLYNFRSVGTNGYYARLLNPPTTYTSIEMMNLNIQKIEQAVDLYQVDVEMKYQNVLTNIYE